MPWPGLLLQPISDFLIPSPIPHRLPAAAFESSADAGRKKLLDDLLLRGNRYVRGGASVRGGGVEGGGAWFFFKPRVAPRLEQALPRGRATRADGPVQWG